MAEHELNKFVDDDGEVFNLRDSTKQPVADRVTAWGSAPSDTKYPSEKLVKDSLDGKQATLEFDGTYNASTNKAATVSTVTNAISGLDVSSVGGNGKYISAISEMDGKISATETNIDDALSATSLHPVQNKELTRWHNIVIGEDGYVSGSSTNPQLSLQKSRLGALSLYNAGVNIKIYSFDENDEENSTLEWDVSTASDSIKALYNKGEPTGTLYQSTAGKWVKILYTGTTSSYFRALGVFMDTKDSSSTVSNFYGHLRIGGVDYPESAQFSTYGSLVVAAYSKSSSTTVELILRPKSATCVCRIFGFRCLNTYTGSDAILIGKASSAFTTDKLSAARKLKTNLARTADSTFDGTANQENIPVTGTLPLGNGGTGKTTAKAAEYNLTTGKSEISDTTSGDDRVVFEVASPSESNGVTRGFRKLSTIWTWIKGLLSSESGVNISGNAATATALSAGADRTKLDGISAGANKVESSSTNGKIKIDGTDTTVYTHPTQTAYSAKGSATKVPKITTDSTGHVTSIEEVTISGVTPASHTHGNIANGGTLTDTAAAATGNDYVVIRDADNSQIQTSTIKGTDVADAVSKKHSHSTLTLSTTAQAYDGTHTLALPSSDPYTSARTPASHTHGNIQNGGTLQTTDVTIANGDKLVVTDSSDSNKVARTSVSFDGSTTDQFLTKKGTFDTVKEADVRWGGSFRTGLTPIEMALFPQNILANPLPSAIKFEKSSDGGTTWTETALTDNQKTQFCNLTSAVTLQVGGTTRDPAVVPLQRGRITISAIPLTATAYENSWCYGNVKRILLNASGSGTTRHCVVETQTGEHFIAHDDVWTTRGDYPITGDSGWNSIPFETTLGGYEGQLPSRTVAIRITFWIEAASPSGTANARVALNSIGILSSIVWSARATNLAKFGLPLLVNNDGTGTIDKANKLSTARKTYVTLGTASTTTTRDWSGDTTIPVDGTLAVSHGGTGLTSVTSNSFLVGNGSSAMVEKTPAQVLSLIGAQGAMTEMTTQEVTDFINDLGDL